MSEQNNVPTAPGWYWVRPWGSTGLEIAYVGSSMTVSFNDNEGSYPLDSKNIDGSPAFDWAGPVPMPGEFVLIPKQSEPDGHTRSFAFRVDQDADGNYVATDLPPMEPTGEWHSFTWDRNTGEMTPRETDKPESTP